MPEKYRTLNVSIETGDKLSVVAKVLPDMGVGEIVEQAIADWLRKNDKRIKAATDSFHQRMTTVLSQ